MTDDIKVGEQLLSPEDLKKQVTTKRGIFEIKIANPLDKKRIIRATAGAIGHAPLESIPNVDYVYANAVETLRVVIVEAPDWFAIDNCLDDELIITLYNEYMKFETDFRRRLRGDKFRKDSESD